MATFAQNIESIRSAKYGKDVRAAIADGIEQCMDNISPTISETYDDTITQAITNKLDDPSITTDIENKIVDDIDIIRNDLRVRDVHVVDQPEGAAVELHPVRVDPPKTGYRYEMEFWVPRGPQGSVLHHVEPRNASINYVITRKNNVDTDNHKEGEARIIDYEDGTCEVLLRVVTSNLLYGWIRPYLFRSVIRVDVSSYFASLFDVNVLTNGYGIWNNASIDPAAPWTDWKSATVFEIQSWMTSTNSSSETTNMDVIVKLRGVKRTD